MLSILMLGSVVSCLATVLATRSVRVRHRHRRRASTGSSDSASSSHRRVLTKLFSCEPFMKILHAYTHSLQTTTIDSNLTSGGGRACHVHHLSRHTHHLPGKTASCNPGAICKKNTPASISCRQWVRPRCTRTGVRSKSARTALSRETCTLIRARRDRRWARSGRDIRRSESRNIYFGLVSWP